MIHLLIVLCIFGFVAWMLLQIPMPQPFKNIVLGILCLVAVLVVLQAIGVDTGFGSVRLR